MSELTAAHGIRLREGGTDKSLAEEYVRIR
jgi:hypothetical protein